MEDGQGFSYLIFAVATLLMIGSSIVTVTALRATKRREAERARSLAAGLGLRFIDGKSLTDAASWSAKLPAFIRGIAQSLAGWKIEGNYGGAEVEIYPQVRSAGKSSSTYLVVRARYAAPLGIDLNIWKEGFFTRVGKALFGLKDVEVGDWDFDRAVRIKCSDPDAARELFSAMAAREAVKTLFEAFPYVWIGPEAVQWERIATKAAYEQVPAVLEAIRPVVAAFNSARAGLPR